MSQDAVLRVARSYIVAVKRQGIPVSSAYLFGSYARHKAREGSDIDIVVELEKPDLFYLIGIKQTIEEALGNKVDVVRMRDKMNISFRNRIERDVVYV